MGTQANHLVDEWKIGGVNGVVGILKPDLEGLRIIPAAF